MASNYGYGWTWNLKTISEFSDPQGDCKIWRGGKHEQGYAMMRFNGEMGTVHSIIASLKYGYKPDKYSGERVTRTCKDKLCVNPDHVIIQKSADIKRKRYHCKDRKVTQQQAREIRSRLEHGERGLSGKLAVEYGVKKCVIDSIRYNKTYKELEDE